MTQAQPEIVGQPLEPSSRLVQTGTTEDTLTRHFLVSIGAGYNIVFGYLDSQTLLQNRVSTGFGFLLDVGYGITRYVEVGLNANYATFGNATECPNCKAQSFDAIGALRYHLVQGVRFDPWLRTGLGLSAFQLHENQASQTYVGLHWFELSIGGDWYFSRNFGIGPLLCISLSSYFDHPGKRHDVGGS